MTPDEWSHIKAVFQRALELSAAGRTEWLAAQSDAVRGEVESLLRAYERDNALPGTSGSDRAAPAQSGQELVGRCFGPYSVLSRLGEGGMGTVWLAARVDGLFTRRVALKLVHPVLMGRSMSERVAREREILASLNHPNIAKLFDAGFAEDGQPYLALEYVEGTPLSGYCDDHHLDVQERLLLFRQVLKAVEYAHKHLVIHRDLKPSNILVSDDGQAHLLDFGIAKLLMPGAAPDAQPTLTAARALTPDYASPEQIAGEAVGTAADVYSLGVILYELLSGERPYRLQRPSRGALEEAILRTEPVAPSRLPLTEEAARARATSTQKLARSLRGDLDTIIAKALKKSPSERYESAEAFDADIARFLSGETVLARPDSIAYRARKFAARHRAGVLGVSLLMLTLAAGISKYLTSAPAAFVPPPHSIAVLPFVNLSGDEKQEYFSDGLTDELLNSLSQINDLQVAARTSSFSFKGKDTDIGTVARKLNVQAVLEGSVRRSGDTVRVTVQLVNAVTGFHLWSRTYDRNLGDVLKLQTEIATAVAESLKVSLLGDISQKIELGGTRNPAAFDAYLHGSKALLSNHDPINDLPPAIAAYDEAIRLDPNYALAFAWRSFARLTYAGASGEAIDYEKAEGDARQALALAPELAEAHLALADTFQSSLDFGRANEEYERALALAPGNALVLRLSGFFATLMGHSDAAIAATRRALLLDPLARHSHAGFGAALYTARRYREALAAHAEVISLDPDNKGAYSDRGLDFYGLGDLESARSTCEKNRDDLGSQACLAVVYEKLGRHADAEAELKKIQAVLGDGGAYPYATIYAQWGDRTKALQWLDTVMRLRPPWLMWLKADPLMDPLRKEPRYQAALRELKFPD